MWWDWRGLEFVFPGEEEREELGGWGGGEEFFEVVGFGAKAGDGADDAKIVLAERGWDSDDKDEADFSFDAIGREAREGTAGGHDE